MKHHAVVATIVLISTCAALSSAVEPLPNDETNWRGAPWWRALRAESYYKQCHSSCTEFSQGTKTTVELCDDSEVDLRACVVAEEHQHFRVKRFALRDTALI